MQSLSWKTLAISNFPYYLEALMADQKEGTENGVVVRCTGYPVRRLRVVTQRFPIKRKKKANKGMCTIYITHQSRKRPGHIVFEYLNVMLVGLLQVQIQANNKSPFDTHCGSMWAFILAMHLYCLALAADMKLQDSDDTTYMFNEVIGLASLVSGSLSSVLLVTILFTHWLEQVICLTLWAAFVFVAGRNMFKRVFECLSEPTKKAAFQVSGLWNKVFMHSRRDQCPPPPPV